MSALSAAFYRRLAGDATLVRLLSTYEGGPAVFTSDPAPADAELPYIVTAGEFASAPFDTKTTRGRQVFRDIRVYGPQKGSAALVEQIAERVHALFHRHELQVEGYGTVVAEASGPVVAPADDAEQVTGRRVPVRLIIQETEERP